MKIQELLEKSKQDLKLGDDLDYAAQDISRKVSQWIEFSVQESIAYKQIEFKLKQKEREMFEHYGNSYNVMLDRRDILDIYIPANSEVINIKKELEIAKQRLEICERTIKTLQQSSFNIKNIIEYRKFMSGVI